MVSMSAELPHQSQRVLLSVRQLAERHPAFTEPALRSLIFKVSRRRSAVPHGDALEAALRRVGRRVLIDEGRFLEWVDVCSGTGRNRINSETNRDG